MSSPEYKKEWAIKNLDRLRIYRIKYYQANKKTIKEKTAKYSKQNQQKTASYMKEYVEINKEQIRQYKKEYYQKNKAKINAKSTAFLKNNIDAKIASYLRRRLLKAMKRNSKAGSAVKCLGCSIEFFKSYMESKFKSEMSWDNYGQWHIDHIIPLNSWNLKDEKQVSKACHYTNLQPLWALDNIKKGAKCQKNL